ncbi:protein kinase [Reticulomyxa filosa]|uniref:Protein kinase n=1 Tax=Reticulomyxa filosa TaxID=46433 RepID=X6MRX1_RETFI|nr:protein kinase [Reticulomyxa filosa]|eukprot:ETO15845.1 protein kinase [Reticulomyxa filosa]
MKIGDFRSPKFKNESKSSLIWGRLVPTSHLHKVLELSLDEVKLGRDKQAHLKIREPQISSLHCIIRRTATNQQADKIPCCEVIDCSINGTYVNKTKIGKGQKCNMFDGDELILLQPSKHLKHGKKRGLFLSSKKQQKKVYLINENYMF